jgi:hypothetical protein
VVRKEKVGRGLEEEGLGESPAAARGGRKQSKSFFPPIMFLDLFYHK